MELIDLTPCIVEKDEKTEMKKESLKQFLMLEKDYDVLKVAELLNVSVKTVKEWVLEFKYLIAVKHGKKPDQVRDFKGKNPSFSQRQIAAVFNISVGAVNKYLKNLEV